MDTVDTKTRSKIMSKVKQKGTGSELRLRKALHAKKFRYRVNVKKLPGSPDLVFTKYKAVIFVHGCFWHQHKGCKYATMPSTRTEFWNAKFKANIERDKKSIQSILDMGWRVLIVWECALKTKEKSKFIELIDSIASWINSNITMKEIGKSHHDPTHHQ